MSCEINRHGGEHGYRANLADQRAWDRARTYRRPEDEPDRINGLRARLIVMEVKQGQAVSHLPWVEGRRSYELWMDPNVAREPLRAQLCALAASLPKSVPACPDEPPEQTGGGEWEHFIGPLPARVMPIREKFEEMKKMSTGRCR